MIFTLNRKISTTNQIWLKLGYFLVFIYPSLLPSRHYSSLKPLFISFSQCVSWLMQRSCDFPVLVLHFKFRVVKSLTSYKCFICGYYVIRKQQRSISKFDEKMYFGVQLSDKEKPWISHKVCSIFRKKQSNNVLWYGLNLDRGIWNNGESKHYKRSDWTNTAQLLGLLHTNIVGWNSVSTEGNHLKWMNWKEPS